MYFVNWHGAGPTKLGPNFLWNFWSTLNHSDQWTQYILISILCQWSMRIVLFYKEYDLLWNEQTRINQYLWMEDFFSFIKRKMRVWLKHFSFDTWKFESTVERNYRKAKRACSFIREFREHLDEKNQMVSHLCKVEESSASILVEPSG